MESQSIWRAQGYKDAKKKHLFLYHQSTGTDKKVLSTFDILWERTADPHYSRESWECGAPSAVTLLCTRSPPMTCVCHAFFCRIQSRVNRNRAFFSPVIRWERTLYCTLNALWVLRGVLAGCAVVLTINHSTTGAAGPVTQLRGREVTVSSLPHTSIRIHDVSVQPIRLKTYLVCTSNLEFQCRPSELAHSPVLITEYTKYWNNGGWFFITFPNPFSCTSSVQICVQSVL